MPADSLYSIQTIAHLSNLNDVLKFPSQSNTLTSGLNDNNTSSLSKLKVFDITSALYYGTFNDAMHVFKFIALTLLPALSSNAVLCYFINKKVII